jgi:hypothetical protein
MSAYVAATHCETHAQAAREGRYLQNGCIICEAAKLEQSHADLLAACEATLACVGPRFDTYRQLTAAIAKAKKPEGKDAD